MGPHSLGNDIRQRRFAEARRPVEKAMAQGLFALLCSLHEHLEPFTDVVLADEIRERLRPHGNLERLVLFCPLRLNEWCLHEFFSVSYKNSSKKWISRAICICFKSIFYTSRKTMSLQSDRWIRDMAQNHGMIEPFVDTQVRF